MVAIFDQLVYYIQESWEYVLTVERLVIGIGSAHQCVGFLERANTCPFHPRDPKVCYNCRDNDNFSRECHG